MTDPNSGDTMEQDTGGGIDKEAGNKWQEAGTASHRAHGRTGKPGPWGRGKELLEEKMSKLRLEA